MGVAFVRLPETLTEFNNKFNQAAPISLFYGKTAKNPEEITRQLRKFYFDDQPITMKLFQNLTDVSKVFFLHSPHFHLKKKFIKVKY